MCAASTTTAPDDPRESGADRRLERGTGTHDHVPRRSAPTGDRFEPEQVIGFLPERVIGFTGMRTDPAFAIADLVFNFADRAFTFGWIRRSRSPGQRMNPKAEIAARSSANRCDLERDRQRAGSHPQDHPLRRVTPRATVQREDQAQGTASASRAGRSRASADRSSAAAATHPVPAARGDASGQRRRAGLPAASPEGRPCRPVERARLRQLARCVPFRGCRGRGCRPDRLSLTRGEG